MKPALPLATLFAAALVPACGSAPAASPTPKIAPPAPSPGTTAAAEARPALRLPADVHPTAEAIELTVQPEQDRFSGKVDIDVTLDRARRTIWLHGRGMHVSAATVTPDGGAPITAAWGDEDDHGMAALHLASEAPAGHAKIHVEYDAPFMNGTKGLFKTKQAGSAYAFTQFEAIDARRAFVGFDEPSFKIPYTVTLDVPEGDQAITNTPETDRTPQPGGLVRVRFAQTKPLPSYLIAFAVGPLDVVKAPDVPPNAARARPLPLRGIAPKGRGAEMAYALAHAGQILSLLEGYFGIEYPYEKLDILAVPDMGGAMENAGAVTFNEGLLLFDEKTASVGQRKAYAMVVGHEFAHQWFGDLVTMAWWDDTWLNESFAEWMGYKIAAQFDPTLGSDVDFGDDVQGAIGTDSLVNARQVHQPITSTDDIENAFDETTYQKGGGVIAMFERWLGPDVFQKGVHLHMQNHRFGNATADDFLGALSTAAGKDVATPYRTFLDQPGVPYVEASVDCSSAPVVHLKQSRFLPMGSSGDPNKTWQIPVCAKYEAGGAVSESCTLLTGATGDLPLQTKTCPAWVFPNAAGTGYYRFALASADLAKATAALSKLSTREKMAYANSLRAGYNRGTTPFGDALTAAAPLAADPDAHIADAPLAFIGQAREWLYTDAVRPSIESYAQKLYAPLLARTGWDPKPGEAEAAIELRRLAVGALAHTAKDARVRAEAKRRGLAYVGYGKDGAIHKDAVDPNLAGTALSVTGEEADAKLWEALLALFAKTDDDGVRGHLLWALSSVKDPTLAARARDLSLDERVKFNEMMGPIWAQMGGEETREATWAWLKEHWDALTTRARAAMFQSLQLIGMGEVFCDEAHIADYEAFMKPRAEKLDGGPRVLAKTLEGMHLCLARRKAEEASARDFFARVGTGGAPSHGGSAASQAR